MNIHRETGLARNTIYSIGFGLVKHFLNKDAVDKCSFIKKIDHLKQNAII